MKNEHAILAAHFLPSILVQLCVLLPYSVLRQWREVYPCASRAPVNHCAIRVIILHNFGQMCPCSLLAGAHITFVGAHLKRPQHRHAMSNTPFQELIWLRIFYSHTPLFYSGTLCRWSCLFFSWYPPPSSLIYPRCYCYNQHLSISGTLCSSASCLLFTVSSECLSSSPCWSISNLLSHHSVGC